MRRHASAQAALGIVCFVCVPAGRVFAQETHAPTPQVNTAAEESRLSTALFREGLKKRGLTDLLELHLKEFPPTSPSAVLLMTREVKLAAFADKTRPMDERRAAVADANRILEQLVAENPDDPRRFDWRMTLAHSLLYEEGESFATNILYFGGSEADRRDLAPLARRAVVALRALARDVAREYERIDKLSAQDFEKIENTGLIEQLDRLDPTASYLLLWAMFYDCLPRPDDDPVRAQQLAEVLEVLGSKHAFLQTPQEKSHVQIPAMLLAGMSARRANDPATARQHLDRANGVAERLTDAAERDNVQWAITLAAIESARAARDDGRFDTAMAEVSRLRALRAAKGAENHGVRVAAALLERSILTARAAAAEKAGRPHDARKDREEAWRALATLAAAEPDQRDALYATLYKMMGGEGDAARPRDPVETCALIAGLLRDAARDDRKTPRLLERAIAAAEQFLGGASGAAKTMAPEVLYNLAVANYRRGDVAAAAARMLEVAKGYPNFGDAGQAAVIAVQLSADLYADSAKRTPKTPKLYRESLETLVNSYANTEASRYWRFYYAQLLEELGEDDLAAAEYARVDREHEHYVEGAFGQLRAMARAARKRAEQRPADAVELIRRADAVNSTFREFAALGGAALARKPDPERAAEITHLLAESRVLVAETAALPGVDRPQSAIEALADFEQAFPGSQVALASRLWRVRLQAFEALGRLDEAAQAVPAYVAADSRNAGPTLQSLYTAMEIEADRLRSAGDEAGAGRRADVALLLARQLVQWSERSDVEITPEQRRKLTVQLAEAHLNAGRFSEACELFEREAPASKISNLKSEISNLQSEISKLDATGIRLLAGHAESLFRLDEFAKALAEFNRLATGLPANEAMRWKSLLRDLECRTRLGEPADGILKVIAQQRRLYPEMGGSDLAAGFDRVERENSRRRDGAP
jgi:hypothetical protein